MTTVTTAATYKTKITGDLPDWPLKDVDFQLVASFFNGAGEEVVAGKTYTMTLDANGNDDGAFYLPTPDNSGDAGANWRVTLPSGYLTTVTVAYSASAQSVRDLIAAGSTTTDPDTITAALASKANLVSGATADNLASLTSGGDLADSGAAAANVPTADEKAWLTAGEAGGALGTAATADTSDFDAAGAASAAQTAAQSYADALNTAMDGRVDILEAALIPVAIADMTATAASASAINLAWTYTAVASITGFKIYRKTGAGAYSLIDTADSGDTSYADSGLDASTEYTYRLDAYNTFFQTAGNEDAATTLGASMNDLISALSGLLAYWPATETSGTVADNAEGTAALDGTYKNTPTLNNTAFPGGGNLPLFDGVNECINLYTAELSSAFDPAKGSVLFWFLDPDPSTPTNSYQFSFYVDAGNTVNCQKSGSTAGLYSQSNYFGSTLAYTQFFSLSQKWHMVALDWSTADNQVRCWYDGLLIGTAACGTWVGTLGDRIALAARRGDLGSNSFAGSAGHCAWVAGQRLTQANVTAIYKAGIAGTPRKIVFAGDSKSTFNNGWNGYLVGLLTNESGDYWVQPVMPLAVSGYTVAQLATYVSSNISSVDGDTELIWINIGVNDAAGTLPAEATWKANLQSIISDFHTQCPAADIYISRVWASSDPTDCATINGWINDVVALYAYVYAGDDESVWLENGDNGATYTSDGTHYNAAGNLEAANQRLAALGY